MHHQKHMRYYSQFPVTFPQLGVGCVRVTHPCATRQPEQALLLPFDLHVLGLPLAFILSQDQTLRSKSLQWPIMAICYLRTVELILSIKKNLRWSSSFPYLSLRVNELFGAHSTKTRIRISGMMPPYFFSYSTSNLESGKQPFSKSGRKGKLIHPNRQVLLKLFFPKRDVSEQHGQQPGFCHPGLQSKKWCLPLNSSRNSILPMDSFQNKIGMAIQ